jgi:L-gulonate 5-dehydrogenase
MRAAVTRAKGVIEVADVEAPGEPGPGEVIVRPQAVGICGSDFDYFLGEFGDASFPRIQGHEVAAGVETIGPECGRGLSPGDRVALHPLSSCGRCYPCRVGRQNTCDNYRLIGIHANGGLQEALRMPEALVFPTREQRPVIAALAEPLSIAVRAVNRARIGPGEHVAILGAGPIGQAVGLLAAERGGSVLMVDRLQSRLGVGSALGAEVLPWTSQEEVIALIREWSGGAGPEVVVDATGVPDAIRAGMEATVSAGRFAMVGFSHHDVSLRIFGFVEKELDVLGVCCCSGEEFGEAVAFVERHSARLERLVSHEFPLERAREALQVAMNQPADTMKVMIGDIN